MLSYESVIDKLKEKSLDQKHLTFYKQLNELIHLFEQLREREIAIDKLGEPIVRLNLFLEKETLRYTQLRTVRTNIYDVLRKEFGVLPPGHYQSQWGLLGMIVFGLPLGITLNNNVFFILGLPIGLAIGLAKDKKATSEGKMLKRLSR